LADVDPKLQSNRVKDLGGTVRPSRKIELAIIVAVSLILTTFALVCSHAGHPFQIFALMYLVSGQWSLTAGQWALAVAVLVVLAVACGVGAWLIASKAVPWATGAKARTRVDVYAPAMGHGEAVEKVTRQRAEAMASRLIEADRYRKGMSPGYPLGLNIVDNTSMYTSWEDMAIVLAGPRSGKSLCYAIPAVLSAPGPCLATSNKGDILDVTAPIRRLDHPNGEIWTFDPERIADPNRKSAPWVWDLIASVQSIADAKRIADCWRYASGQPQTGGDDFFPGTAAQQLADYLFAAHLGGRSVSDVFRWCSNERDTSPADILSEYPRYAGIASRVSSVIALTPETRSGVFGSLQTMVAFLADPEIIDWIDPHRDTNGNIDERRGLFDPYEFATSEDTLYLLSAQGRPSTALTASLTAVVAFTAFQRAQSEFTGNNRRLPVPLCCVLDEAANICRWPELADVYSYFGSAGIPIMTIWQNPDQGRAAFGETNFGSLFNNANITVYLGGIKDAKFLGEISQLVGQREIVRGSVNIDGTGRRSVNNSIQKENILDVSDLTEWPVGRALLLASADRQDPAMDGQQAMGRRPGAGQGESPRRAEKGRIMSEHTSNTTSGPDGEEWERAVGAARTLLSSDCGWLELFTRAILEEKGVPYGKGLPNPEAPHIPEDKEIEEETMPGQGEPTPTAPEVPAGRHAAEPIRSGIPADAGETGNGYENPPEDATDRDDTPPKAGAEESDTRILPAPEGKTDLGRDESGDLDPARARDVSGQFGARMRRSETYYPNLAAFVERFVANVFCYHQSASVNMQWVSDWWRYPALVFPLDAMWRAYENARKAPGQMMIFYIQAASMLDRVFDKDRGIVASLDCKQNLTRKGEPLPCERPNRAWREPILETLSVPAAGGKENKETTITPTRRRNNGSN